MDWEEYAYFKGELMKRKTQPYHMANPELAKEYFTQFKSEYPEASFHSFDISQFICLNDRARKNLIRKLQELQRKKEAELQALKDTITEIEGGSL